MTRKYMLVAVALLVVCLTIIVTNLPIPIAKAAGPNNDTVLLWCRFDGDPAVGVVVWATTKSANAPTVSATSCAQAISEYLDQGFWVVAESTQTGLSYYRFTRR